MNRKTAFTLVDVLIALLITLTGMASMVKISTESDRAWRAHREQLVAREILGRLQYLPLERLGTWGTRNYDALGRPHDGRKPVKYTLEVMSRRHLHWTTHRCQLHYRNGDDAPVTLEMIRKEWEPDVRSQSL